MLRYIFLSIHPEFLRAAPSPKLLQTCSNGTFSPVSRSSAFPVTFENYQSSLCSGKPALICPEPSSLSSHTLSDSLPSRPSPPVGHRFCTLNSTPALKEMTQPARLWLPRCVLRILIIVHCYGAHAAPSLNCLVTEAKKKEGVHGGAPSFVEESWRKLLPLLCCVIGVLLHLESRRTLTAVI